MDPWSIIFEFTSKILTAVISDFQRCLREQRTTTLHERYIWRALKVLCFDGGIYNTASKFLILHNKKICWLSWSKILLECTEWQFKKNKQHFTQWLPNLFWNICPVILNIPVYSCSRSVFGNIHHRRYKHTTILFLLSHLQTHLNNSLQNQR
jgi:hypothetical protein